MVKKWTFSPMAASLRDLEMHGVNSQSFTLLGFSCDGNQRDDFDSFMHNDKEEKVCHQFLQQHTPRHCTNANQHHSDYPPCSPAVCSAKGTVVVSALGKRPHCGKGGRTRPKK